MRRSTPCWWRPRCTTSPPRLNCPRLVIGGSLDRTGPPTSPKQWPTSSRAPSSSIASTPSCARSPPDPTSPKGLPYDLAAPADSRHQGLIRLGGRTRARTWDPLIKGQLNSLKDTANFFKLSQIRCIRHQGLAREIQTTQNQITLVDATWPARRYFEHMHRPVARRRARPDSHSRTMRWTRRRRRACERGVSGAATLLNSAFSYGSSPIRTTSCEGFIDFCTREERRRRGR